MGIEFKLTDSQLPASPAFVLFLDQQLAGRPMETQQWPDQRSEALAPADPLLIDRANEAASRVMSSASGREQIGRAYQLFVDLLTGDLHSLRSLQERYEFLTVNGVARTGGSYLTAELYRALGMQPEQIPNVLAHDGFPDFGPFCLTGGSNSWLFALKMLAEWLTMVQLYFSDQPSRAGRVVVPKKLAQSVYAGGLFAQVLGKNSEHLLTVRHPAAACVSTYEKSGGLPAHGRFAVRSNIEAWCLRDLLSVGLSQELLEHSDYFDVYLRYWELHYTSLVTTGLTAATVRVVPFDPQILQQTAQSYHERYHSGRAAAQFEATDRTRHRHPEWVERSKDCLLRTAALWERMGQHLPLETLVQCW
jgi:hypothetical protein